MPIEATFLHTSISFFPLKLTIWKNMSENSSITVDQPTTENGNGQGEQVIQLGNMPPPLSPPTARRILVIPHGAEIVSVLAYISRASRQAVYILSGRGCVSRANLVSLPIRGNRMGIGRILYLSGWFQPMLTDVGVAVHSSRPNGILHVSLSGVSPSVAIAYQLFAFGDVEVDVFFVCGPGSIFQPDAPGAPRERVRVNGVALAQAPAG
ncbi:transmembrane protein [Arabidopsis thaliana]|uniref:Transmembrane protein n=5 Tax=Arabidopsis TaxID=3701 RepID=Q1PE54_ARATH|nr:uncharacterized protein AT4G23090 [Arabidopsis thaliana]ABE66087.1 hypothetical protein At4g23090 [Arabidopsis thaliana]AEE84705.1 transmembrane protein [Arabidopsis thaliana]|eukprot:NP_001078434.1 transmembrane protein [Arabidopsis thaliana]